MPTFDSYDDLVIEVLRRKRAAPKGPKRTNTLPGDNTLEAELAKEAWHKAAVELTEAFLGNQNFAIARLSDVDKYAKYAWHKFGGVLANTSFTKNLDLRANLDVIPTDALVAELHGRGIYAVDGSTAQFATARIGTGTCSAKVEPQVIEVKTLSDNEIVETISGVIADGSVLTGAAEFERFLWETPGALKKVMDVLAAFEYGAMDDHSPDMIIMDEPGGYSFALATTDNAELLPAWTVEPGDAGPSYDLEGIAGPKPGLLDDPEETDDAVDAMQSVAATHPIQPEVIDITPRVPQIKPHGILRPWPSEIVCFFSQGYDPGTSQLVGMADDLVDSEGLACQSE